MRKAFLLISAAYLLINVSGCRLFDCCDDDYDEDLPRRPRIRDRIRDRFDDRFERSNDRYDREDERLRNDREKYDRDRLENQRFDRDRKDDSDLPPRVERNRDREPERDRYAFEDDDRFNPGRDRGLRWFGASKTPPPFYPPDPTIPPFRENGPPFAGDPSWRNR